MERTSKVQYLESSRGFLIKDKSTYKHSPKNPWLKAVLTLQMDPRPHFHDLRHTWKINAGRSGMDQEIRERILGHWNRARNVNDRYGRISDTDLVNAIDMLTFDHGGTEILIAK